MGLISDEFGPGVKPKRRRSSTIKYYSIGPSNNQVITLLVLAAAGGAAAMYFVPQLPNYITGLFKGTETPQSVIQKVKTDINNRKSSRVPQPEKTAAPSAWSKPAPKPIPKQTVRKPLPNPVVRTPSKSAYALPKKKSHFTYYWPTYRY